MGMLPETASCRTCGYALRGLPNLRCPECGQAFDPDQPATYRIPLTPERIGEEIQRWNNRWWNGVRWVTDPLRRFGTQTVILALMLLALARDLDRYTHVAVLLYVATLWIAVPSRLVWGIYRRDRYQTPRFWKSITAMILLFILVNPTWTWKRNCQHGDVWMVGRIGVAHSVDYNPCPVTMPWRITLPLAGGWCVVIDPGAPVAGNWR